MFLTKISELVVSQGLRIVLLCKTESGTEAESLCHIDKVTSETRKYLWNYLLFYADYYRYITKRIELSHYPPYDFAYLSNC